MINKIIYLLLFQLTAIPSLVLAGGGMPAAIVQVEEPSILKSPRLSG